MVKIETFYFKLVHKTNVLLLHTLVLGVVILYKKKKLKNEGEKKLLSPMRGIEPRPRR